MNQMNAYNFSAVSIDGDTIQFSTYQGHVLLIVNTASKGLAMNDLQQLQLIYKQFESSNFTVLAFPCRQFLHQESKVPSKIRFRYQQAGIAFPVFTLTKVNGPNTHQFYRWLKEVAPVTGSGKTIEWNFTRFLVLRDGINVQRISPTASWEKVKKLVSEAVNISLLPRSSSNDAPYQIPTNQGFQDIQQQQLDGNYNINEQQIDAIQ
ncbi:Glutathione peroxidase [Tritrichomonas foetus]|uniref:Glutathione peroxidase n=1 Tax=Tritrichomonas foetus TaxID=1144522 RepID=A0A1J4KNF5_9EUKA|nr:Glutathione peroxidase [Tritrichomonas foetus]|eukprot:OHT10925.1 Glutathione peroxidase [Tritrichomonas foetus]